MANAALAQPAGAQAARSRDRSRHWVCLVLLFAVVAVIAAGIWAAVRLRPVAPSPPRAAASQSRPILERVGALGRLTPEGEVITVASPVGAVQGGRIDQLLVAVGDRVEAGQVVAVLNTYPQLAASLRESEARVEVARAKLALVKAGAKPEDVRAQEVLTHRYQAELAAAELNLGRVSMLLKKNAGSRQEFEDQQLKYQQAKEALNHATAQLEAIKAVRPVDVAIAEAELALAEAALAASREDLKAMEVRAPIAGRILRIHTRPGERAGDEGILDMGNTDTMHVVAEVYEEDVGRIRVGQTANVRVPTLGVELAGAVVDKDLIVGRKDIFGNDPVSDVDSRVVEVRIRLSPGDSARVAGLSNARVEVKIDVGGGAE